MALATALVGCDRSDIQVYRVEKEPPAAADPMSGLPPAQAAGEEARPRLRWRAPETWEEQPPGDIRLASFRAKGPAGEMADISIIPLPGMAGTDLDNVNRWRGQVSLPPVTEEEMAKEATPVSIDGQPAQLHEQAGKLARSDVQGRILAVILRRDGIAWFFKMSGDDAWVAQQKPHFLEFLKSVNFVAPAASELPPDHPPLGGAAGGQPVAASADHPEWQPPANWQEVPGGTFLVAKFQVKGAEPAQAAVNVSSSPGEGGGLAANVNRWRQQLGLPQATEDEIAKSVQQAEAGGEKIWWADLKGTDAKTGQPARLVAAMVPRAGRSWFYKLMGDESVVGRELDAFTKFVQTVKYSNAR